MWGKMYEYNRIIYTLSVNQLISMLKNLVNQRTFELLTTSWEDFFLTKESLVFPFQAILFHQHISTYHRPSC